MNAAERGITENDREQLESILAANGTVPATTCAELRRRARDRVPAAIAGDEDIPWSGKAIWVHAYGSCTHDDAEVGVEPAEPRSEHEPGEAATRAECDDIRRRAANGEEQSAIARDLGRSQSTICRHASGECPHPTNGDAGGEGS